jgi:predicted cupin superfamily sugar epimerase
MSKLTAEAVIAALGLASHFEGGVFRETYRPRSRAFQTARGPRGTMSSIYYMLTADSPVDHFHTKHSAGIQYHHFGDPLTYHLIHQDGRYERVVLGPDLAAGQVPSLAVEGGTWKAAELASGTYGLVSEVVSPAWEMEDMILVTRAELLGKFPQHEGVITRLTPNA